MKDFVALSIFTLLLLAPYYHYGDDNHIEQLPFVTAQLDPSYLKNDVFVSYTRQMGPRFYFTKTVTTLSEFIPQEYVFFIMTYLSHLAINIITFFIIKSFIKDKYFPYFIVYVLARFQHDTLGDAGVVNDNYLTPQLLAMPFILTAIYASMRGRYFLSYLATLIALPIHPSLSLLASVPIAGNLILNHKSKKTFLITSLFFVVLLSSTYFLFIKGRDASVLDSSTYIHILAYFRHPHHYVPSHFRPDRYAFFFAETAILVGSFIYLRSKKSHPPTLTPLMTIFAIAILMLPAGFIFVEAIPIKQIVELQIFRVLFIHRWLFVTVSLVAFFSYFSKKINPKLLTIACFLFSLSVILLWPAQVTPTWPSLSVRYEKDRIGLYDFIASHTSPDSLFLTPPNFGSMRIVPKRAIVVDWKAFPFNQKSMVTWYDRIQDSYGQGDLEANYRLITDEKLMDLKTKYNFDYVVLYVDTDSQFESVYSDSLYKLIKI